MVQLEGKVSIITGATKGIGFSIAKKFLEEGCRVIGTFSKDEEAMEEALKTLKEISSNIKFIKADSKDIQAVKRVCKETIDTFGKIDILVNNAGISKIGLLMDSSIEDIQELMAVNLLGPIYFSKEVSNHMLSNGGSIINISSIWGEYGASCESIYSASKGGINTFTKALARELAMGKIRVNAVSPGVINTKMNSFLSKEEKEELEEEIPMGRFGEGEEVSELAVFLASDKASYITGQIIKVDGGMI
ncbi:glucose 1-dehydrogenase [uncultured Clostridium sp.]|uniref:elongation factor P 5-aminopentanone reductase n=1 Tax=uncultured Clostridium sp. TaxID=59620 RepID=UPI0026086E4D|nr:glucose 1-dehydrogenase [uncultured Clostridium sp.]